MPLNRVIGDAGTGPRRTIAARRGRTVSRVLFPLPFGRGDDHLSGTAVAGRLKQPTRGSNGAGRTSPPIWPCSDRGLPCPHTYVWSGGLLPHRFTLACVR